MIEYNFGKLRGRIKEKLGNEATFAELLGISAASLSSRFNNKSDFTASEIQRASEKDVLDLTLEEIGQYFFTKKLETNSRKE